MATQKLNIDIVAKDRSKQALGTLQGSLGRLEQSVFNLRNAFIGLGAGLVIRNIVNTGKQLENLQVKLKFLFGNAQEGAKAFDEMAKFAARVPFSLEQIQQGSGVLATVAKDANELAHLMEITGNVAAVTGLDFQTTSSQIQRSMSAGIGAADLFREKGVRAMLGFQAGAEVSIEETVAAFNKVFGKGGKFGNATKELAKTFEGTLSMIGDKIFNFKKVLLEAGFFRELKNQFGDLNKFLEDNGKKVDALAKKVGKGLAIAFKGLADTVIFVKDNIDKFALALGALISMKVAGFFYGIVTAINAMTFAMKGFNIATKRNIIFGSIMVFASAMGFLIKKFREFKGELNEQEHTIESLTKEIEKYEKILSNTRANVAAKKNAKEQIVLLEEKINLLKQERDEANQAATAHMRVKTTFDEQKSVLQEINSLLKKDLEEITNVSKQVTGVLNDGIKGFSKGIAESIVLGKELHMTMKELAQTLSVKILSIVIETITRKGVELAIEKMITREKEKQAGLKHHSTGSTLFSMAKSFLGFGKASGGAVSKGQPVVVGERGAEMFIPNQSGQITQAARGTGGGTVNVNFNIEAIDSSSFNSVLVENRGIITSIINNALNEKGRRELV